MLNSKIKHFLNEGAFIPAHPLALTSERKLDEKRQRALTRYYIDAGVGGIAVGVHTTQFEIRDPQFNLYEKVLRIAMEEVNKYALVDSFINIAGICGSTKQAMQEAEIAKDLGYHLGLLSFGDLDNYTEDELIEHTKRVAEVIPIFGFYLQPAVGGRDLSFHFWKRFSEIPNVHAIKVAPFDRYKTLDVIRGVCHSSRAREIALYTGNDDNIVFDLLSSYEIQVNGQKIKKRFVGGLLGHWAVWVKSAVDIFNDIKKDLMSSNHVDIQKYTTLAHQITDANAAFFDTANHFKGVIAGINEVLTRQGILKGNWCLLESETLSEGQREEIDRVYKEYPHLNDDEFVRQHLDKWLQ